VGMCTEVKKRMAEEVSVVLV